MSLVLASGIGMPGRLAPVDLRIEAGEFIALVGPNGGGKTSLLRALAGVEGSVGRLEVAGEDARQAPPMRRMHLLSFLPASRDMAWPIAVRSIISLGLPGPDRGRVDALLRQFELTALATRPVDSLSTGERARVLIARALAARPALLLLDEPLANLEPYWALRMIDILREHVSDRGGAALVSLHDLGHAPRFDRALLIAEGKVRMDKTPADLLASERFLDAFRLRPVAGGGFAVRPADPQSSP